MSITRKFDKDKMGEVKAAPHAPTRNYVISPANNFSIPGHGRIQKYILNSFKANKKRRVDNVFKRQFRHFGLSVNDLFRIHGRFFWRWNSIELISIKGVFMGVFYPQNGIIKAKKGWSLFGICFFKKDCEYRPCSHGDDLNYDWETSLGEPVGEIENIILNIWLNRYVREDFTA